MRACRGIIGRAPPFEQRLYVSAEPVDLHHRLALMPDAVERDLRFGELGGLRHFRSRVRV